MITDISKIVTILQYSINRSCNWLKTGSDFCKSILWNNSSLFVKEELKNIFWPRDKKKKNKQKSEMVFTWYWLYFKNEWKSHKQRSWNTSGWWWNTRHFLSVSYESCDTSYVYHIYYYFCCTLEVSHFISYLLHLQKHVVLFKLSQWRFSQFVTLTRWKNRNYRTKN